MHSFFFLLFSCFFHCLPLSFYSHLSLSHLLFTLSLLICSVSGHLSLPCSPLFIHCLFLSPLVCSVSFSLPLSVFISVCSVYSMPPLSVSHTQDSPCPPLYFSPHQSDVPIFLFYFPLMYLISLCLYPPLSLTHTATQR